MITLEEWLIIIGMVSGIIGSLLLAFSITTKTQTVVTIVQNNQKSNPTETTINKRLFSFGIGLLILGFIFQIIFIIIT